MSLIEKMSRQIEVAGGLIVSCQPVPASPLDKPEIVAAMALAANKRVLSRYVSKVLRI